MSKLNIIHGSFRYLLFLTLLFLGVSPRLQAQETTNPADSTVESTETVEPDNSNPSPKFDSIFSIEGGKRLMTEADQAIDSQEFSLAAEKLQSARQVYNQLSNFYLQLFNSFSGLDNAAAESHRKKALETSIERDKATYQLALVHRSQNQPELSIPLLVQIVTSQSPLSGLGKKAYEQLLEIGFVDAPITPPAQRDTTPPEESQPPATPPVDVPPAIDEGQIPEGQPTIPNPQTPGQ
ncbi:MAG: hypothetical protein AAGE84_04360 [Cyanobacteria bacterium P01_G01_bin.39]